MIFFVVAVIFALLAAVLLAGPWASRRSRLLFGAAAAGMVLLLVLCGIPLRVPVAGWEARRRIVAAAVDVSASTRLGFAEVRELLEKRFPEYNLLVVPFSDRLRGAEGANATALVDSLAGFDAMVAQGYADDRVAGSVVITDGNETERPAALRSDPATRGDYPHNAILLQGPGATGSFDKTVFFLEVPRFVPRYRKERVTFAVQVTGGSLAGAPVELRLDGKNLGSVFVPLTDGYGEGSFDLIIREPGSFLLEATVAPDARERAVKNNSDYAVVEGILKGFRVLHVSGRPSPDTAFMRRGLQNIPGVDMISFYILRTQHQATAVPESELSLIPFPTDQLFTKELDNFDLIIMNDFSLTTFMAPQYLDNMVRFVRGGGGLLMFGGPNSYREREFLANSFRDIVPVVPGPENNWQGDAVFNAVPAACAGLASLADLGALRGIAFRGINRVTLREGAVPFFSAGDGSPFIAGFCAGKGRVVSVMSDSFWRVSYDGGMSNERALRALVRYVMGVSTMPVRIFDGQVAFDPALSLRGRRDLTARILFRDSAGGEAGERLVTPDTPYALRPQDPRLMTVQLFCGKSPVDTYRLVAADEKLDNEFTPVPSGGNWLARYADAGKGRLVAGAPGKLGDLLEDIKLRAPVIETAGATREEPLYRHKGTLVLFVFLALAGFYLKSRYSDFG